LAARAGFAEEHGLAPVAALGDVTRLARNHHTRQPRHACPSAEAATTIAEVSYSVTVIPDAQGRLVKAVYSDGYTITYTYDAAGNRTAYVVSH
jgi:YD repeat-containing protein